MSSPGSLASTSARRDSSLYPAHHRAGPELNFRCVSLWLLCYPRLSDDRPAGAVLHPLAGRAFRGPLPEMTTHLLRPLLPKPSAPR